MGAVLACGSEAVLSHRSAAVLWGIRDRGGGVIDVTTPGKRRSLGAIKRHSSRLPADEIAAVAGIPVTTVPRTLFDLAAILPDAVESALRQAEYLRLHDRLSLCDLLARYPGRRGSRTIRRCLDRFTEDAGGRTRSPLEERFLPFLDRHQLPRPRLNAWIEVGGRSYEVDCLWPAQRQIVELDGWRGHGTRAAFREDRTRDRRLRVAGYGVTRIAWGQLDDESEAVAADLRHLLMRKRM